MPAGFGMPSKKMDEQTRLGSGLHSFFNSFFVQAMPGQLHTFSIHKLLGLALPTIVKRNGKKSLSNSFEYSYFYDCEKIVLIWFWFERICGFSVLASVIILVSRTHFVLD